MDSVIENNEKEENVLALKRGYIETLENFVKNANEVMIIRVRILGVNYNKRNLEKKI